MRCGWSGRGLRERKAEERRWPAAARGACRALVTATRCCSTSRSARAIEAARGDADRAQGDPAAGRHHLRLRHPRPGGGAREQPPRHFDAGRIEQRVTGGVLPATGHPVRRRVRRESNLLAGDVAARSRGRPGTYRSAREDRPCSADASSGPDGRPRRLDLGCRLGTGHALERRLEAGARLGDRTEPDDDIDRGARAASKGCPPDLEATARTPSPTATYPWESNSMLCRRILAWPAPPC